MLKHRHTHASIYSHIRFVSPDQQCGYELQFVDLRSRNTTEEKMASISILKRNCFSLELKAEIINAVDMKITTLKCSPGTLYTFLKDKEAMKHNPRPMGPVHFIDKHCSYLSDKNGNFHTSKPTAMPYERAIL